MSDYSVYGNNFYRIINLEGQGIFTLSPPPLSALRWYILL